MFADNAVVKDLNNDGKLDLISATCNNVQDKVEIFRGKGDGTFSGPMNIPIGQCGRGIIAEDFNGDSYPDIAVAVYGEDKIKFFFNNGRGLFNQPTYPSYEFDAQSPWRIEAIDVNNDSRLDLIYLNHTNGNQYIHLRD